MIQVMFTCANQYTRVMRSADGTNYRAMCPKCGKAMRFDVGDGGTDQRTFFLSCR